MEILPENIIETFKYEHRNRAVNPVFSKLRQLKVGEGLHLTLDEWTQKTRLNVAVANFGGRSGMKFSTKVITDGAGWIIKRVA